MDLYHRVASEPSDSFEAIPAYQRESPPLAIIMGRDRGMCAALRCLLAGVGCDVAEAVDATAVAAMTSTVSLLIAVAGALDDDVVGELVALRRLGYDLPAIVVARGASSELRRQAFALGVVDVIGFTAGTADVPVRLRTALEYARHEYMPAVLNGGRADLQVGD